MLSFFKRSKTRNNDKHAAKHQNLPASPTPPPQESHQFVSAAKQHHPIAGVAATPPPSANCRTGNRNKAQPTSATAGCDYKPHQRHREFSGEQQRRDGDELPHRGDDAERPETVASDRRRDENTSTTEHDNVVVGSATAPVYASNKQQVNERDQEPSAPTYKSPDSLEGTSGSSSSKKHHVSTSLFGGFLGEIMAKGRNRRQNHNNNSSGGANQQNAKNSKMHHVPQKPSAPIPPVSEAIHQADGESNTSVGSNYRSSFINGGQSASEIHMDSTPAGSDHLHSNGEDPNTNFYETNSEDSHRTPAAQTQHQTDQLRCDDSLDFDSASKNRPVEFIDDDGDEYEHSPNGADIEPTSKFALPRENSTTTVDRCGDRDSISRSPPPETVVATKHHHGPSIEKQLLARFDNGDRSISINDPDIVKAHSSRTSATTTTINNNNNTRNDKNISHQQHRPVGQHSDSHTIVDLRHDDDDDFRHNRTNTNATLIRDLGKNRPSTVRPYDHTTRNAVAENTTGAASSSSSESEFLSNAVEYLRSELKLPESPLVSVSSTIQQPATDTSSHGASIRPIPTISDRAPLAAVSDDEFDSDFDDPNEDENPTNEAIQINTNRNALDLNQNRSTIHLANDSNAVRQQMGQQPTKPTASSPGVVNHHPNTPSRSTPPSYIPIPPNLSSSSHSHNPNPTPDEKDIFYEAAGDFPATPSPPYLADISPTSNKLRAPNQFKGPGNTITSISDRSVYSEPKNVVNNHIECNTINCTSSESGSKAANINNSDRFVPTIPAANSSAETTDDLSSRNHQRQPQPEEQHHEIGGVGDEHKRDNNDVDDGDDYDDDDDDDDARSSLGNGTTNTSEPPSAHIVNNDNEPKQTVISLHHPNNHNHTSAVAYINNDDEYDCCEDDDGDDADANKEHHQEHGADQRQDTDGGHSSAASSTTSSAASSSDDDPENDSPDSGIDVVADIADISRILNQLESCGTADGGDATADASSTAATGWSDPRDRNSLAVTDGGGLSATSEHLVRSTSSGLESDLSSDDPQCEKRAASTKREQGSGAFTGDDEGTKDNDDVLRKCDELGHTSEDRSASGSSATKQVRPGQLLSDTAGLSADEPVSISLPDIVESTSSNTPVGSNSSSAGHSMVASGVQHVGGGDKSADTSCSSASESESSDCGGDEKKNQRPNHQHELIEGKMRDLVDQEARFSVQLEEAEKQAFDSQAKANDLSYQISELERNLTVKIWNVERLQAELQAAFQEGECVKRKVKQQEVELEAQRKRFSSKEEEWEGQYTDLETQHRELKEKLDTLQTLESSLRTQLEAAQNDARITKHEKEQCQQKHADECIKLQATIDAAILEKTQLEVKWQKEFEQLRTHHSDREEHLLQDCEWKLRTTEQACKAKMTAAEGAKKEALESASKIETEARRQIDEVKHLRSYEAEVCQLRGLTGVQSESIVSMTQQLKDLKEELQEANQTVAESIETVRKIKFQCEQEISDKHRQMINMIDEARGDVAVMWEDRLMEEMSRLKIELESCYAEDRAESLQIAQTESLAEIAALKDSFSAKEKELCKEIAELKLIVAQKNSQLEDANERSDKQVMQIRMILDRSEREHEREMGAEVAKREELAESMRLENESERQRMEEIFRERLLQVSQEFATELTNNNDELEARHKKKIEQQYEKLMADKEETVQQLERTHKRKTTDWETKFRDIEIDHQRSLKDMKSQLSMERSSFEQRDHQSAQEIDQLHKKCKCLTKLFEEMRMRYERRDPRPEDLRDIEEMKSRLESQDRELSQMTEQLRRYQVASSRQQQQQQQQQNANNNQQQSNQQPRKQKGKKDTSNKAKVNNCNVIYEENEDRETSPNSNGFYAKTAEL